MRVKIAGTALIVLALFLFTGCAKKVVRESQIGAEGKEKKVATLPPQEEVKPATPAEKEAPEEIGATTRGEGGGEKKAPEEGVSAKIEEALKGLEGEGKAGRKGEAGGGMAEEGVKEEEVQGKALTEQERAKGKEEEKVVGEKVVGEEVVEAGKGRPAGEEKVGVEEKEEKGMVGKEEVARALPEEEAKKPLYEGLTEEEKRAIERIEEMVKKEGRLLPVYFDFDKYSLREDARETLKKNALWLKAHPDVKILIEGHADERGSNEYNLALGEKRARSVLGYLKDLGVDVEMSTISYGEERPVCFEHNEDCWWRNRRAEFRIVSE